VSLNESRRIITILGPPLAKASQTIQANIAALASQQQALRENTMLV